MDEESDPAKEGVTSGALWRFGCFAAADIFLQVSMSPVWNEFPGAHCAGASRPTMSCNPAKILFIMSGNLKNRTNPFITNFFIITINI